MREPIQSLMSFSWACMLFGPRQLRALLTPSGQPGSAAEAFQHVADVTQQQLPDALNNLFGTGDKMQRDLIDTLFGRQPATSDPPASGDAPLARGAIPAADVSQPNAAPQPSSRSNCVERAGPLTHLVLGEGIAAGLGDFSLSEDVQRFCFANLLTQQMGLCFRQPLVQAPGLSAGAGFSAPSPSPPGLLQTTLLDRFPPRPFSNLAIPGMKVADVLTLRPALPLVHADQKQTTVNILLGLPGLLGQGERRLLTPLEVALRLAPACVIVGLGYFDFLEPAIRGDVGPLPEVAELRALFARILAPFAQARAEILILTIPDPIDTAYFSSPQTAARLLNVEPAVLDRAFGLADGSLITVNGLLEIAEQILRGKFCPLRPDSVLGASAAHAVSCRVETMNAELASLAQQYGAVTYDLHALFRRVRDEGVQVGSRRLTGEYFGGFYSLNGCYPGPTAHAVIAADLVKVVNDTHATNYSTPDLQAVLAADPVVRYRPAAGRDLSWDEIAAVAPGPSDASPPGPICARPAAPAPQTGTALRLPPGLEQVLPLNKQLSYHGDGIRIVRCEDERESQYGSCGNLLFGGLAMFGSHLSGELRFQFTPPEGNLSHFTIHWGDGLVGDDGVIAAPNYFRLPAVNARVFHWPGTVVSGDLDLQTGEVTNLDFRVQYVNSALGVLVKGNPNFPKVPIQFPGAYGTASGRFVQRPDGLLDFVFHGSTFLPLGKDFQGDPFRWPLQFGALSDHPASVPAAGTAMHPYLHLNTQDSVETPSATPPQIPTNTVLEFTLHTHNSSFGDLFSLDSDKLGGSARGRSQVMGRLQIQFGERFGDSVPIAVSALPPGGLFWPQPDLPFAADFPGRLPVGLIGHDEFLRFPRRTYFLDGVNFIDDPFDLALGAVDLRTGAVIGDLVHRGFIGQNLFFALVRVEPRTPRSSFQFRGPASFEAGPNGQLVYRFNGQVHIPYPEGYSFPAPDLTTHYVIGPNSALDPFLRLQAMHGGRPPQHGMRGGADKVVASNGNLFSYRYALPPDPRKGQAAFEYVNHSQGGTFRMRCLAWVSFTRSRGPSRDGDPDTVTFTGYGNWSRDTDDQLHVATVQVSTAREAPYVSIQIDTGDVSNVNTKPTQDESTYA